MEGFCGDESEYFLISSPLHEEHLIKHRHELMNVTLMLMTNVHIKHHEPLFIQTLVLLIPNQSELAEL